MNELERILEIINGITHSQNYEGGPIRARLRWALEAKGKDGVIAELLEMNKAGTWPEQILAIRLLGQIGDESTIDVVLEKLGAKHHDTRANAAKALGGFRQKKAADALLERLATDRKYTNVVFWAARSLGNIGDERAVKPLKKLARHRDWEIRFAAVEGLGKIGGKEATGALIKKLVDNSPRVRVGAAKALGKLRDESAIWPLIDVLRKKEERNIDERADAVRAAREALASFGPDALRHLFEASSKQEYIDARPKIARVLQKINRSLAEENLDFGIVEGLLDPGQVREMEKVFTRVMRGKAGVSGSARIGEMPAKKVAVGR